MATKLSELIGGHVALDLVNTIAWRLDEERRVDRIADLPAFVSWADRAGLTTYQGREVPDHVAASVVRRVITIREDAHAVLEAQVIGRPPPLEQAGRLHAALSDAVRDAPLPTRLPWRFSVRPTTPDELVTTTALAVFDLVVLQDLTHLGMCHGEGCGWMFLDRSRSHNRQWCSSADCGNRDRVRRFTERAKSGSPSTYLGDPLG